MVNASRAAGVRWRDEMRSDLAGTVSGALVLGVGGRLAMAALPVVRGVSPRFSWLGSLEVVLLGAAHGSAGELVWAALWRRWRSAARTAYLVCGMVAEALVARWTRRVGDDRT
jgi:hypothetical protein